MAPFIRGDELATWCKVDYTETTPITEGIDMCSGYGFAFPTHSASAKTTMCGVTQCIAYHHGIPYSAASGQETHIIAKECGSVPW